MVWPSKNSHWESVLDLLTSTTRESDDSWFCPIKNCSENFSNRKYNLFEYHTVLFISGRHLQSLTSHCVVTCAIAFTWTTELWNTTIFIWQFLHRSIRHHNTHTEKKRNWNVKHAYRAKEQPLSELPTVRTILRGILRKILFKHRYTFSRSETFPSMLLKSVWP